ncbi:MULTISPECIES: DUF1285 domain-containing protein [Thalassotalea]|uniref:DUF1285 domain-containing protein n=1 Tax=Thalassotalea castellviae TaxID=3075612 RepID=A0ABU3A225_9GAMM|nr:DUF1285 domain-containing protein [Thalassotalea sp. W431]MDT0603845.1 DUF1285 domain-containing protein [Thalassotalea sp. W431]
MSLDKLSEQLKSNATQKMPPVELWDPPYCGEIDLQIKADGQWFHNGTAFKRMSLVKLFASVLKKEADEYFLVTPVEKVKITVEDAPLLITQWIWLDDEQTVMQLTTNLDDTFILSKEHPLTISDDGGLYVTVRRNLMAKVHRNVYYQWVNFAQEVDQENEVALAITSDSEQFILGYLE